MNKQELHALLSQGPVLLDGATGSNLLRMGMPAGSQTHSWVLEHPEVLIALQRAYVAAGTRILYAPTFQCQRLALAKEGRAEQTEALNRTLVEYSRQAAGGQALVVGDLTTLAAGMETWDRRHLEEMIDVYRQQIRGLLAGGADLLVAETLLYPWEGEAVLKAAEAEGGPAVLCSLTMKTDGTLYSGQLAAPALRELEDMGAAAVGFNCVAAGQDTPALVSKLRRSVRGPLLVKPNAGLPRDDGSYPMGPEEFSRILADCASLGAKLLGGCCGTAPEYIRAVAEKINQSG